MIVPGVIPLNTIYTSQLNLQLTAVKSERVLSSRFTFIFLFVRKVVPIRKQPALFPSKGVKRAAKTPSEMTFKYSLGIITMVWSCTVISMLGNILAATSSLLYRIYFVSSNYLMLLWASLTLQFKMCLVQLLTSLSIRGVYMSAGTTILGAPESKYN